MSIESGFEERIQRSLDEGDKIFCFRQAKKIIIFFFFPSWVFPPTPLHILPHLRTLPRHRLPPHTHLHHLRHPEINPPLLHPRSHYHPCPFDPQTGWRGNYVNRIILLEYILRICLKLRDRVLNKIHFNQFFQFVQCHHCFELLDIIVCQKHLGEIWKFEENINIAVVGKPTSNGIYSLRLRSMA